jgi:hypothetical protein
MKVCSKCKVEKPFSEYQKNKSNKDGFQYQCKQCRKESCHQSYKKNFEKNADTRKKRDLAWRLENREKHLAKLQKYRESTRGKAKKCALEKKREASKLNRTPKWADFDKIQMYYNVCAFFNEVNGYTKYHVDHVVPLQGKNVSGLHVQNNLQVILAQDNVRKGNRHNG